MVVKSYITCKTTQKRVRLGEGWDPPNMFNPAILCMYVPVPSQEPVIQWLSFVYALHICLCVTYLFFGHFFYINKAVSFLF